MPLRTHSLLNAAKLDEVAVTEAQIPYLHCAFVLILVHIDCSFLRSKLDEFALAMTEAHFLYALCSFILNSHAH